jgi:hypothetical protein
MSSHLTMLSDTGIKALRQTARTPFRNDLSRATCSW